MARNPLVPFPSGSLFGGDPFVSLHREVNRLFDDVLRATPLARQRGDGQRASAIAPQMNVSETESEVCITAELPGVSENDIQIELNDDVLSLRGEKKEERKQDTENYHVIERSFGTFQRSLQLPFTADPDRIQARFENGVLKVTVPKNSQQERSCRIQIQSSGSQTGLQDASNGQESSNSQAASNGLEQSGPTASGSGDENSGHDAPPAITGADQAAQARSGSGDNGPAVT